MALGFVCLFCKPWRMEELEEVEARGGKGLGVGKFAEF